MLSGAVVYPAGILVAVLILVLRGMSPRTIIALVAVAHLTILASVALFPLPVDAAIADSRAGAADGLPGAAVNLIPFRTIGPVLAGRGAPGSTLQLVQNTFVLLPAGLYGPLLWPSLRSAWFVVPFVVLGGASIELAQLTISTVLGFRYRSIDVDDAILNAIGLALGWLAVVAVVAVRGWRRRRSR